MRTIGNTPVDGEVRAVASGALANGDTVVVNSDGTVSVVAGTSGSTGTEVQFEAVEVAGSGGPVTIKVDTNKVLVIWAKSNEHGTAVVGTVSGTSISFGSADTFSSAATTHISGASLGTSGNVVLSYNSSTGSGGSYHSYMQSIVATASGTSVSFGTPVTWLDPGVGGGAAIAYGTSTVLLKDNTFVTAFSQASDTNSKLITGTVSGTSITMDTSNIVTYSTSDTADRGVAVVDSDRICIAFRDIGDSNKGNSLVNRFDSTNLTAENYIGMAKGAAADGTSAVVQTGCSINDAQSGLTAGQDYFVQTDGTLGTSPADPSVFAGTAVSATKLIVKG